MAEEGEDFDAGTFDMPGNHNDIDHRDVGELPQRLETGRKEFKRARNCARAHS